MSIMAEMQSTAARNAILESENRQLRQELANLRDIIDGQSRAILEHAKGKFAEQVADVDGLSEEEINLDAMLRHAR
jgi:hypothetical protein